MEDKTVLQKLKLSANQPTPRTCGEADACRLVDVDDGRVGVPRPRIGRRGLMVLVNRARPVLVEKRLGFKTGDVVKSSDEPQPGNIFLGSLYTQNRAIVTVILHLTSLNGDDRIR
jgi:hypothetical protein